MSSFQILSHGDREAGLTNKVDEIYNIFDETKCLRNM